MCQHNHRDHRVTSKQHDQTFSLHHETEDVFFRRRSDEHRQSWSHRRSSTLNQLSLILPSSPIIEVASNLSSRQLSLLAYGPKYVPPCQSRFSRLSIDDIIAREYKDMVASFTAALNDHCLSAKDQRAQQFFSSIETLLRQVYTAPISPKLFLRARFEHRMIQRMRRQLANSNAVLRRTDKSKVFHLGNIEEHHRKALQYMHNTHAYREIADGTNPCFDHLQAVLALIDPLLKKKAIDLGRWRQDMRPNANTIELAHLYFNPKPHKVIDIASEYRPYVIDRNDTTRWAHHCGQLSRRYEQQRLVFHVSWIKCCVHFSIEWRGRPRLSMASILSADWSTTAIVADSCPPHSSSLSTSLICIR